ncbi:hypothetical protein Tco_1107551 [Tanacetum coccineum]
MDDPNITMEEYIQLMADKARGRDKMFNWETATCGEVYCDDSDLFTDFETFFPAIIYNDASTSNQNVSSEPTDLPNETHVGRVIINLEISNVGVIMESLVKKKQKGAILELKRRHLKNTIFCTYTPYPAMKIRRISASSAQETRNDQFPIRRIHYNQYAVCTAVHQSKIRI